MKPRQRLRALYGAGAVNFLVPVASFAIAGAAVAGWFQRPRDVVTVLEWFAAAIVLHDLVALPLYSVLDRIAHGSIQVGVRATGRSTPALVDPAPYLRIPAILSGLLLLVFFPACRPRLRHRAVGQRNPGERLSDPVAAGHRVIFAGAATAYAVAVSRRERDGGPASPLHLDGTQRSPTNSAIPARKSSVA